MKLPLAIIVTGFFLVACSPEKIHKIGLQPFGGFDKHLVDTISAAIERNIYGAKTFVLEERQLPDETFINVKAPRYRADRLIEILRNEKPDSMDYIIGLTTKDISFTKKDESGNTKKPESKYSDWGIFGLGYRPGASCVVSTYRLQDPDDSRFIDRVKKVAIHEVGHNLGLPHCDSVSCVMRDAVETIKTIDSVTGRLCLNCRKKIKSL